MIGHSGHFSGHYRTFRTLFGHVSGHDTGHLLDMTGHVSGHDRTGSDSITCADVQNVQFETGDPGHILGTFRTHDHEHSVVHTLYHYTASFTSNYTEKSILSIHTVKHTV